MLTLLIVLMLAAIGFCLYRLAKYNEDEWLGILVLPTVLLFIFGSIAACKIDTVLDARVADEKIAMYEEQNAQIETDVDILVQNYMDHEFETLWATTKDSAITLVSLYPELKSDALVQEQIRIYTENNEAIRQLKEKTLDASKARFWLYFGH